MNNISIIVPTYNAQKYLVKLLDKIRIQSIKVAISENLDTKGRNTWTLW